MKVVTVRSKIDGSLVCFGPNNDMYEPQYDAETMCMQVEDDEQAAMKEWGAKPVAMTEREIAKNSLKDVKDLNGLLAVLEKLL